MDCKGILQYFHGIINLLAKAGDTLYVVLLTHCCLYFLYSKPEASHTLGGLPLGVVRLTAKRHSFPYLEVEAYTSTNETTPLVNHRVWGWFQILNFFFFKVRPHTVSSINLLVYGVFYIGPSLSSDATASALKQRTSFPTEITRTIQT